MKKFFLMAVAALLTISCTNNDETVVNAQDEQNAKVPVRVHVDGFSVTQEDFPLTRTETAVGSYADVKAITLAFYKGSTEVMKTTQIKTSLDPGETFGEFECSLDMGSYTMVVIASGNFDGDVLNLTSPTSAAYTSDHVRETFAATQEVNVTSNTPLDLTAVLNRVIAKVVIVSTDNRTADVANIRATFSAGGKSFSPTTGLATVNTGFSNTMQGANIGTKENAISYVFLATDEQTMDVTIETLDAEQNVLFSKTVSDVPLKRNRVTTLTGAMFTAEAAAGSFTLNSDWLSGNNVGF